MVNLHFSLKNRWHNHLDPSINKEPWTEEEDELLIEKHEQLGNKWAEISKFFSGRTDNMIKNRWNSTIKRRVHGNPGRRNKKKRSRNTNHSRITRRKQEETKLEESESLDKERIDEFQEDDDEDDIIDENNHKSEDMSIPDSFDLNWTSILSDSIDYNNDRSLELESYSELSIPNLVPDNDDYNSLESVLTSNNWPHPPFVPSYDNDCFGGLGKRQFFDFFDSSPEAKKPCYTAVADIFGTQCNGLLPPSSCFEPTILPLDTYATSND